MTRLASLALTWSLADWPWDVRGPVPSPLPPARCTPQRPPPLPAARLLQPTSPVQLPLEGVDPTRCPGRRSRRRDVRVCSPTTLCSMLMLIANGSLQSMYNDYNVCCTATPFRIPAPLRRLYSPDESGWRG